MSIPNEDIFCNKIEVKVFGGDLCDDIMRDMSISLEEWDDVVE